LLFPNQVLGGKIHLAHPGWFYAILFLASLVGVLVLTPLLAKFALFKDIVDKPGMHKIHRRDKPLLGGLGLFLCFAGIILVALPLDDKLISLVAATVILTVTGLIDDIYDLKPLYKVFGQAAAAVIVVLWNAHLFRFMIEYFADFFLPAGVVLFLIIGWLVLMINAFNMIDGMDGLAAGTAAIIFLAMALLSAIEGGTPNVHAVQLIGAGACLGFLVFNFNPAKVFMGDTGSMLLGFILATTHLFTIKYPFDAQLVLGSMFIFAYPALDVGYAMYRRLRKRSPMLKADKGHIHHVFLSLGYSVRKTALIIYGANIIFALLAVVLLSVDIPSPSLLIIWIITALGVITAFAKLTALSEANGLDKAGPGS